MEEILAERYRIVEQLGKGHGLSTYRAADEVMHTEVEIDVLDTEAAHLPVSIQRLKEMLEAALAVSSPHAGSLFGWWEEGGILYLVREGMQGTPLSEILAEVGELPLQQVLDVVEAATEVLAETYGRKLFYLGLNPGQVLVDPRGRVKLSRVGYGWVLEESHPLLAARVSPYRAPETDGGVEGSRTSDVYSLAIMIREMLPHREGTSRLHSLLDRCADPLPKRRPSSPRLLLEELEGVERARDESGGEPAGGAQERGGLCGGRDGGLGFLKGGGAAARFSLERRPRKHLLRTLLLIVAGGVAVWVLFAAVSGALSREEKDVEAPATAGLEGKVTLPDLQGMTLREAAEVVEGLGLHWTSREAPSRLWSAGRVAVQEPREGALLEKGDDVRLVVSTGRDGVDQPQGESTEDAPAAPPPAPAREQGAQPAVVSQPGDGAKQHGGPRPASGTAPAAPAEAVAPHAVPVLSTRSGSAPLYVVMDGSGSYDRDGTVCRYVWYCGDGTVLEGVSAQHVYDPAVIPAVFRVVLQVFDADGLSSSCSVDVEVY